MSVITTNAWAKKFAVAASDDTDKAMLRFARMAMSNPLCVSGIIADFDAQKTSRFFSAIFEQVGYDTELAATAFDVAANSHTRQGAHLIERLALKIKGMDKQALEALRENSAADAATVRMGTLISSTSNFLLAPKALRYAIEIEANYKAIETPDYQTRHQLEEIKKDVVWIRSIADNAYQRGKCNRTLAPGN